MSETKIIHLKLCKVYVFMLMRFRPQEQRLLKLPNPEHRAAREVERMA